MNNPTVIVLMTDTWRLDDTHPEHQRALAEDRKIQRRVYRVIGPSRNPNKIRIETWSHAGKTWSLPHTIEPNKLLPAPEEWPQTRAAKNSLQTNGDVRRRRL